MNPERSERIEIPVLPLRDVVVYPHMVIPLFVGREKSIRCLEAAMDHDKKIMLVAQKEASTDEPGVNDLFTVGTVASILQMLKLPDGTVKVLVEGLQRARITTLSDDGEHFSAKAEYLDSPELDEREQEVLVRTAISQFEGYIKLNKKIPPEVLTSLNSIDDPARLADTIAAHMPLKLADKQPVPVSAIHSELQALVIDHDQTYASNILQQLQQLQITGQAVHSLKEANNKLAAAIKTSSDYTTAIIVYNPQLDLETMLNGLRQLSSTLKIALAITFSDLSQTIKDYSFDALLILPLFATNLAQVLNKMHQTNTTRTQHLLPSAANEPNCSGKRILLVEDNPLNMEIACELIGMTGAMIEEATDGAAALTKIAQAPENHYDLVFMDVQMPKLNGYDATKAIRKLSRKDVKSLPIVAMTANAFLDDIKKEREAGMNAHITKPFHLEELFAVISEWLQCK